MKCKRRRGGRGGRGRTRLERESKSKSKSKSKGIDRLNEANRRELIEDLVAAVDVSK